PVGIPRRRPARAAGRDRAVRARRRPGIGAHAPTRGGRGAVAPQAPAAGGVSDRPPPDRDDPDAAELLRRLDPERASASRQARRGEPQADGSAQTAAADQPDDGDQPPAPFGGEELPRSVLPPPVIDPRRYRWMIGIF